MKGYYNSGWEEGVIGGSVKHFSSPEWKPVPAGGVSCDLQ
jgi:hypothetical protein